MTELDVQEAARILGVTERTVRRWLKEGRLEGFKVGGRVRIPEHAVREAATPYGTQSGDASTTSAAAQTPRLDPIVAYLTNPDRKREALRRRRERAAERMDEIRARSKPPRDENDTVEAYIQQDREERDRHWDEILGLTRS